MTRHPRGSSLTDTPFPYTCLVRSAILRPSILFGREDHLINLFATMMRLSPIMPVIAPGAKFQPVYVGDVAEAVVAALASDAAGKTYELGRPPEIGKSTRLNSSH